MYAVCRSREKDVLAAVKEMERRAMSLPVIQLKQALYDSYDASRVAIPEMADQKEFKYAINIKTKTLHRSGCSHLTGAKNIVGAYLFNPRSTGLDLCKSCMK